MWGIASEPGSISIRVCIIRTIPKAKSVGAYMIDPLWDFCCHLSQLFVSCWAEIYDTCKSVAPDKSTTSINPVLIFWSLNTLSAYIDISWIEITPFASVNTRFSDWAYAYVIAIFVPLPSPPITSAKGFHKTWEKQKKVVKPQPLKKARAFCNWWIGLLC